METKTREGKVTSEDHLAREPKVENKWGGRGEQIGGTEVVFPSMEKRCHMTQQKQTTKEDECKGKYTTASTPLKVHKIFKPKSRGAVFPTYGHQWHLGLDSYLCPVYWKTINSTYLGGIHTHQMWKAYLCLPPVVLTTKGSPNITKCPLEDTYLMSTGTQY